MDWLGQYEKVLLHNAAQISSIESSLRSLTFVLPGRFKDVEVASEGLYSVLQLLGMYHDAIIARAARRLAQSDPSFRASPHNRYTHALSTHSKLYRHVSLLLSVTRHTELLWEMVAARADSKLVGNRRVHRWNTIVALETIKAVLRLMLVFSTRQPALTVPTLVREVDPETLQERLDQKTQAPESPGKSVDSLSVSTQSIDRDTVEIHTLSRTKICIPSTPRNVDQFLTEKVLLAEDVKPAAQLLHLLSDRALAAEVVYIVRPLIYALLLYRFRDRPRNWTPWLVGFGLEYLSRAQLLQSYRDQPAGLRGLTKLEATDIVGQRGVASLAWWMLRSTMYTGFTGPLLHRIAAVGGRIPGINLVSSVLDDYLYLFDEYYFSSAVL